MGSLPGSPWIKPLIGILLLIPGYFLLPVEVAYSQGHLNRFWEAAVGYVASRSAEPRSPF